MDDKASHFTGNAFAWINDYHYRRREASLSHNELRVQRAIGSDYATYWLIGVGHYHLIPWSLMTMLSQVVLTKKRQRRGYTIWNRYYKFQ